jgi:RNA ligase (TIGR02306 family)
MSDIAITVERIESIEDHPNAERLEVAKILGTQVVVPKEQYHAGEHVVYFPPDMMLPSHISTELGVQKYLKHSLFDNQKIACRVAACRLRGIPSYGFINPVPSNYKLGDDLTDYYHAQKYEPPTRVYRGYGGGTGEVWGGLESEPDNFHRFTDIQNFWKYHKCISEGTPVRMLEKAHGTNSRVALLKVGGEWNFYAGSHKTARKSVDPEGRVSVYWEPFNLPGVLELLTDICNDDNNNPTNDVIVFGELYGPGVQDLDYNIPAGEVGWRCYDISVNGRYLDWSELVVHCVAHGIHLMPVLYVGPFSAKIVEDLTNGPTILASEVKSKFKGREGIVITPLVEAHSDFIGRLILKSVSADYRDRKGAKDEGDL